MSGAQLSSKPRTASPPNFDFQYLGLEFEAPGQKVRNNPRELSLWQYWKFSESYWDPCCFTMADLFSFLEDAPEVDSMEVDSPNVQPRKRKAKTPDTAALLQNQEAGPSEPKRPRIATPQPAGIDDVEIEAKREVAASAGLTGSVEAGSLELRHQVCDIWDTIRYTHITR